MNVGAVVLAGGLGTRMLPLTLDRPKHLLPVGGVPFLAHPLMRLGDAGIRDVVLATSYRADQFEPALGDGSSYGVRLTYVTEAIPLGTGGALANAAARLDPSIDVVVVVNGDLLGGHDLRAQLDTFASMADSGSVACLHVREVADAAAYGRVTVAGGRVRAFAETSPSPGGGLVNGGTYAVTRRALERIPRDRLVSLERDVFPVMAGEDALGAYVEQAYWLDVGSPAALVRASRDVANGAAIGAVGLNYDATLSISVAARVAPDAQVDSGSCLLPGAVVAVGAQVRGSIVMEDAVVGAGALVVDCVVGPRAVVPAGATLRDAVVVSEPGAGPPGAPR